MSSIETQIEDLQVKFSFQENTIEALNKVVLRQQRNIDLLNEQVTLLRSRLDTLSTGENQQQDNEPPPHY